MFFDTHCHLNFQAFDLGVEEVIDQAKEVRVDHIVIPGTNLETSKKAIKIAEKFSNIYAAVGIHPHHVFEIFKAQVSVFSTASPRQRRGPKRLSQKQKPSPMSETVKNLMSSLSKLLSHPKVVAVGEVGMDRHIYKKTKHQDYKVNEEFVDLQKVFFIEQIKLAHKYNKSLIIHNREAKKDLLELLTTNYSLLTNYSSVIHCCEPDKTLLAFAKSHKMFIGVDGDITYYKEKQEFIKTVPLNMLVLETDSPFLIPEISGSRSWIRYNEPKNIPLIAEFIAKLKNISVEEIAKVTTENARKLFKI